METVRTELKPARMDGRTSHRTLLLRRALFQTEICKQYQAQKGPRKL
jgi:hypothetical protein